MQRATDAKTKTGETQIKEEVGLAWNGIQTEGIVNGWTLDQKARALQTELKKEDSSATATASGNNVNVKSYKGYDAIINTTDGKITSFAKASEGGGSSLDSTGNIRITDFSIAGTPITNVPLPSSDFEKVANTDIDNSYVARGKAGTDYEGDEFVWVPVDKNQEFTVRIEGSGNIASVVLTNPVWDTKVISSNIMAPTEITGITPIVEGDVYNGEYKVTVIPEEGEALDITLDVYSLYAFNVELMVATAKNALGADYEATIKSMGGPKAIVAMYSEPTDNDIDYSARVATNGGFWIGRYEASYNSATEKAGSKVSTSTRLLGSTSLSNGMLWNNISRTDALTTAKAYNTTLKSSLPTGATWDRTLGWIYEKRNSTGKSLEELSLNSTSWGNYGDDTLINGSNDLINTGSTNETMANNIYDLAGNLAEWSTSTEYYPPESTTYPAYRGGIYKYTGTTGCATSFNAEAFYGDYASIDFGFRLVLYN